MIIARSASDHIVAHAALKGVRPRPAVDDVVAALAKDVIDAVAAADDIVAGLALDLVVARLAVDDVVAQASHDDVVTATAADVVILCPADDLVVAAAAVDRGRAAADDDDVVAAAAEDGDRRGNGLGDGDDVRARAGVDPDAGHIAVAECVAKAAHHDATRHGAGQDADVLVVGRRAGTAQMRSRADVNVEHAVLDIRQVGDVVAGTGHLEVKQTNLHEVPVLRYLEETQVDLDLSKGAHINKAADVEDVHAQRAGAAELCPQCQFVEANAPVGLAGEGVLDVVQVEVDSREDAPADDRPQDADVQPRRHRDLAAHLYFRHVFAGAVRVLGVAQEEAIEDIKEVAGLLELVNTRGVKAEGEVRHRRYATGKLHTQERQRGRQTEELAVGKFHLEFGNIEEEQVHLLTQQDLEGVRRVLDDREEDLALADAAGQGLVGEAAAPVAALGVDLVLDVIEAAAPIVGDVERALVAGVDRVGAAEIKAPDLNPGVAIERGDRFREVRHQEQGVQELAQFGRTKHLTDVGQRDRAARQVGDDRNRLAQHVDDRPNRIDHRVDLLQDRTHEVGEELAQVQAHVIEGEDGH